MSSFQTDLTPVDRPDLVAAGSAIRGPRQPLRIEPTRVIEVGAVTAGIAVPEGRAVRFFSSSRDFDGLDGAVFRSAEQAARAARERVRALTRRGPAGRPRLQSA